jgi:hypothetical protein
MNFLAKIPLKRDDIALVTRCKETCNLGFPHCEKNTVGKNTTDLTICADQL